MKPQWGTRWPLAQKQGQLTAIVLACVVVGCGPKHAGEAVPRCEHEIGALLRQSTSTEPGENAAALAALDSLGLSALPELAEALRGPYSRDAACELARLGEPAASALLQGLGTTDAQTFFFVAWGLRRIGPPAIPLLREALRSGEKPTRAGAACVLGFIGEAAGAAEADLLLALEDVDPEVRSRAAEALGEIGRPLNRRLLGALGDKDVMVRVRAASAVAERGEKERAVAVLIAALADGDREVQHQAVNRLVDLGSPAARKLADALGSGGAQTRLWAARILGRLGSAASGELASLLRALEDENADVREAAAFALCRLDLRTDKIVPPLVQALGRKAPTGDESSGLNAAYALSKLGPPAVHALASELERGKTPSRDYASLALARIGSPAVNELVLLLDSQKPVETRRAAARTLATMGADANGAVPSLCSSLSDKDTEVRIYAARSLGYIGPGARAGTFGLASMAADTREDVRVRRSAALAIAGVGHAGRLETRLLLKVLADEHPDIRNAAALAIGRLLRGSSEEALAPPLAGLRNESPRMRASAAQALGHSGSGFERVELALTGALTDEDQDVQRSARQALDRIHQAKKQAKARESLMHALGDDSPWSLPPGWQHAGFLEDVGPDEVPLLVQALRYRNPEIREMVVRCLGQIGSVTAIRELAEATADPDLNVRDQAVCALGGMGPSAAVAALDLVQALRGPSPVTRRTAAWALGNVTREWENVAVGPLIRALECDSHGAVRASAAQALQELPQPPPEAVKAVERALGRRPLVDWWFDQGFSWWDSTRPKDPRLMRDEILASERGYQAVVGRAIERMSSTVSVR